MATEAVPHPSSSLTGIFLLPVRLAMAAIDAPLRALQRATGLTGMVALAVDVPRLAVPALAAVLQTLNTAVLRCLLASNK